ncbi:MAG: hypothetical protein WAV56_03715, partial [Microgenomates group bacterium]
GTGSVTLSSATASGLTIESGTTGSITLGGDASAETISLGAGAAAKTVVLGSTDTTSTTTIQSGSGNINLLANGTATGNVQVGDGGAASATPDLLVLDTGSAEPTGTNGAMYYNTTTNKFRCYQNGAWSNCIGGDKVIVGKSADESVTSSIILQNDDDLLFSVKSGETWIFRFVLVVTNNNDAGPDWKSAILAPAASTCSVQLSGDEAIGADFPQIQTTDCTTPATLVNNGIVADANNGFDVLLQGRVTAGADGTVNLQWAQNTSDTTALTVEQGSRLEAFKVGGADLAEVYYGEKTYEEGTVVSVEPAIRNGVRESTSAYDRSVVGIVSTKPGLVLGDNDGTGATNLVALSGRVPVKVTTENGPIRAGDYLTSSSIPGVAMKATKAGAIIGTAMMGFDGPGEGTVLVFVKNGSGNGSKIADLLPGLVEGDVSRSILGELVNRNVSLPATVDLSEIVTDRVAAGVEVITPKLMAQDIELTGSLSLFDANDNAAVKIESNGDAYFAGTVRAKKIIADQIEGYEILTNKIDTLGQQVATVAGAVAEQKPEQSPEEFLANFMELAGQVIFKAETWFKGTVKFLADVTFVGRPTFNKDTAGFAYIKGGQNEVEVKFEREYAKQPVVTASLNLVGGVNVADAPSYAIYDLSIKGFKIKLARNAGFDLAFSWVALAVDEVKAFEGQTGAIPTPTVTLEAVPSPIPTIEVTPPIEVTPTATESATPTPTPTVAPIVEVTPTATESASPTPEP